MLFHDRHDAGKRLAEKLDHYAGRDDVIVLGLPRGGVPVAFEVANRIKADLDLFTVRKLGVPAQEELAMGAVASGGVTTLNEDIIEALHISDSEIQKATAKARKELERRETAYRGDRPPLEVRGKVVIVVDDGLATGSTMRAATIALKKMAPGRLVVAVPVAAISTCKEFEHEVDETICLMTPDPLTSVGQWYEDFSQTTDEEVQRLLGGR